MNFYIEKFQPEEILEYLRKSRSDDPTLSVDEVLSRHREILKNWEERNLDGFVPEENIYREVVSGETLDGRPEILRILKRIEDPRIKAILVVDVQRLSRGDLEDCGRLIKLLRYTKTHVITPQKTYDLDDEYDRDAFERELKRGNEYLEYFKKIQNRGRLQSVASGNYLGTVPPYGFDKAWIMDGKRKCPTLALNEDSKIVEMIFDLFVNKRMGCTVISHHLDSLGIKAPKIDHWTYQTVHSILSNPHYNGKVIWYRFQTVKTVENMQVQVSRPKNKNFLCYDGKQPKLIPDDMYQKAQALLAIGTHENYNTRGLQNMFSGILYCECGHVMNLRAYKQYDKDGKYCGSRSANRYICPNQSRCNNGSVLADEIIRTIFAAISAELEGLEALIDHGEAKQDLSPVDTISLLSKQLEALERKRISLWDKYTDEAMPRDIFEALKDKCEKDMVATKEALNEAYTSAESQCNLNDTIYTIQQASRCIYDESLSAAEKNILLKAAIKKITYSRPRPNRYSKPDQRSHNLPANHGGWINSEPDITIEFNV